MSDGVAEASAGDIVAPREHVVALDAPGLADADLGRHADDRRRLEAGLRAEEAENAEKEGAALAVRLGAKGGRRVVRVRDVVVAREADAGGVGAVSENAVRLVDERLDALADVGWQEASLRDCGGAVALGLELLAAVLMAGILVLRCL